MAVYAHSATRAYIARRGSIEEANLEDFEDFFRREFPKLARSLAFAVGDIDLGADLAQEAFARALARWNRYEDVSHARHSVAHIGMNLVRSHWRRAVRTVPSGLDPREDQIQPVGADERLVIWAAISALSARQRSCVVLVDYLGFDTREAGRILRIPPATVRVHLTRGRRNLAKVLAPLQQEMDG